MTRFLQHVVILFSSIILIASCGGGGGGGGGESGPDRPTADDLRASVFQFSGILDAQGFVFTGDNPTSGKIAARSANLRTAALDVNLDANSLYKVRADGTLDRVVISDDADQEITRGLIQPAAVRDIDQNFMIMYFVIKDQSELILDVNGTLIADTTLSLSAYLVHKTTGLAYLMDSLGAAAGAVDCEVESENFSNNFIDMTPGGAGYAFLSTRDELKECRLGTTFSPPRFTTDDQSNIYLRVDPTADDGLGETYVFKIDTQNLTGTTISATQLHTQFPLVGDKWGWEVDPGGEYVVLGSGTNTYYLDIASGAIINLEQELATANPGYNQIDNENIYKDLEGKMYVWGRQATGQSRLFRIDSVEAGNSVFFDMNSTNTPGSAQVILGENMDRMVVNGRLLYVSYFESGFSRNLDGFFIELDPETGIVGHDGPRNQFSNGAWEFATLSNGYFYYFGEYVGFPVDTVYRYNPATKTGLLFAPNENSPLKVENLDVSEVRVINDDEVWFRAVDLDDSSTVFGTADIEAGTIDITGTTAAAEPVIFIMQAIVPSDFISIDGRYNDWAIDLRVISDTAGGSQGHDLAHLSHQQSSTQFFALVEFVNDNIKSSDSATILTVDSLYDIVVRSDAAFIVTLLDDSEATFGDVGGISAIGQAVELSVPLSALTGVGTTPVVTVRRVSLNNDITVASSYSAPSHTVSVTLPRVLETGENITIQLKANFELTIDNASATVTDTSGPTNTDVTGGGSGGFNTNSITVVIDDSIIGTTALSPTTTDQLDITEDDM